MGKSSMVKISSGWNLIFRCVGIAILILIGFKVFSWDSLGLQASSGRWVFIGLVVFMMILGIFIILRHASSIFESADGTFLRVRISFFSEKTLPLSAIESVDVRRGRYNTCSLRIKVKRQSSANGFSPAVFYFIPNVNYFRSALFRQFPISQDFWIFTW